MTSLGCLVPRLMPSKVLRWVCVFSLPATFQDSLSLRLLQLLPRLLTDPFGPGVGFLSGIRFLRTRCIGFGFQMFWPSPFPSYSPESWSAVDREIDSCGLLCFPSGDPTAPPMEVPSPLLRRVNCPSRLRPLSPLLSPHFQLCSSVSDLRLIMRLIVRSILRSSGFRR